MTKKSVGIVYHFFAHYRDPILDELSSSENYDYWFVGDRKDPSNKGIRGANIINHPNFIYAPSHFWKNYLLQEKVIRFALRKDIDEIIYLGSSQFVSTWFSAILARLSGKDVYFWTHGWTHRDSWANDFIRHVFYHLAKNGLLLYGVRARNIGIEKGFDPKRLYVIYNSLDYERCKRIRQRVEPSELESIRKGYFFNPNLPTIICTSRLVKERSLNLLLEALGILKNRGCELNTLIVGDGVEKARLEQKANRLNLSTKFLGECYDERKLARLFMSSEVTVVPNYIGLTAIHSLGYGIPVIANDNPETNGPEWEIIQPGENGDLYRYGDIEDLADKIITWTHIIRSQKDKLRDCCIQSVEQHYTPKAQREAIEYALSGNPAPKY